jgi:hypothetical protein
VLGLSTDESQGEGLAVRDSPLRHSCGQLPLAFIDHRDITIADLRHVTFNRRLKEGVYSVGELPKPERVA